VEAIGVYLGEKGVRLYSIEIMGPVLSAALKFLIGAKNRAIRRFDMSKFGVSFYCNKLDDDGVCSFAVFGQVPKSSDEDSAFSLDVRFKLAFKKAKLLLERIDIKNKASRFEI
jgi:hypothetical protein